MRLVLFCAHSDFVKHLEAEVEWYRTQMARERQRAEVAIDELIRLKVGAGPVSRPLERDPDKVLEDTIARLGVNPEFTGAGATE